MRLPSIHSLSWRLTMAYTALVTAVLLVFGLVAYFGVRYVLFSAAARQIEATRITVTGLTETGADQEGDYNHVDLEDPAITAALGGGPVWVQIATPDGKVLNRSRTLDKGIALPTYVGPATRMKIGENDFLLTGGYLAPGATLQIARSLEREDEFLSSLAQVLLLVGLAGLVPAVVGGRAIAHRALRPIETLTRTTRGITVSDLGRRIPLAGPRDELHVLGETVNGMLQRLDDGFRRQKEFVAAASHDLRTPLTVIRSYSDLLERWGASNPEVVAESSRAIGGAAFTMERLVQDLLLLAHLDIKPKMETTRLRLDELAAETVKEARAIAPDVEVAEKATLPVEVLADEAYIRRAVWALVDNALKHGGPKVEVSTGLLGTEAFLSVTDNGPGLTPEELSRIFERFYRADRARTKGKGFGLGLPTARAIVEAHGGRIEAQSGPGQGTRFTILLPLAWSGGQEGAARPPRESRGKAQ